MKQQPSVASFLHQAAAEGRAEGTMFNSVLASKRRPSPVLPSCLRRSSSTTLQPPPDIPPFFDAVQPPLAHPPSGPQRVLSLPNLNVELEEDSNPAFERPFPSARSFVSRYSPPPQSPRYPPISTRRSHIKMPLTKIGRYRLTRVLGVGMFSRVVIGIDDETGEEYAVKVMNKRRLEELNMDQYARREALVMHRVRHANIVEFVEAIQSPKKLFLVMRVVPGLELLDIVEKEALPESEAKHYMRQLVDAIAHLHTSGYCHRDIKPENVLIDVATRRLVVIDLGLCGVIRRYSPMLTSCGSAHYSAPETTFGNHHGYDGIKSDAWSVGILAFIMLCGAHPFVDINGELMHDNLRTATVEYPVNLSSCAVSFMRCLLTLAPRKRSSVAQVRNHPWLNPVPFEPKRPRGSVDLRHAAARRSGTSTSFANLFPRNSTIVNGPSRGNGNEAQNVERRRSKGSTNSFSWFRRPPLKHEELAEDYQDESRATFVEDPRDRSSSIIGLTTQVFSSFASSIGIERQKEAKEEEPPKRRNRTSQDGGRVGRHLSFTFKRGMFPSRKAPS